QHEKKETGQATGPSQKRKQAIRHARPTRALKMKLPTRIAATDPIGRARAELNEETDLSVRPQKKNPSKTSAVTESIANRTTKPMRTEDTGLRLRSTPIAARAVTAVGAESSTLSAGANGRARHSVERHFAAGSRRTPRPT